MSQPRLAQRALPTEPDEGSGLAGKRRLYLPNKRLVLALQSRHPPSQQLIKLLDRCIALGGKASELGVHGSTDSCTDCPVAVGGLKATLISTESLLPSAL